MTVWMKLLVLLFPIVVYAILWVIFRVLDLGRFGRIQVIDIWTPFLVWGLVTFTKIGTDRSILPYYLLILSAMGLFLILIDLIYFKQFSLPQFLKRFWRAIYMVSLAMYLFTLIATLVFR